MGSVETTVAVPADKVNKVKTDEHSNTTLPEGTKVSGDNGETTYVDGAAVDKDGKITSEGATVTKTESEDGKVVITANDGKSDPVVNEITLPESGEKVTVSTDGTTELPAGSTINGVLYPDGATINADGTIDGEPYVEPELTEPEQPSEEPAEPSTPSTSSGNTGNAGIVAPTSGSISTAIDDGEVPLASGPVTRAEFIDYLWRHEGRPEGGECTFTDVAEDHEYVLALGWAQATWIKMRIRDRAVGAGGKKTNPLSGE